MKWVRVGLALLLGLLLLAMVPVEIPPQPIRFGTCLYRVDLVRPNRIRVYYHAAPCPSVVDTLQVAVWTVKPTAPQCELVVYADSTSEPKVTTFAKCTPLDLLGQ